MKFFRYLLRLLAYYELYMVFEGLHGDVSKYNWFTVTPYVCVNLLGRSSLENLSCFIFNYFCYTTE